MGPAERQFGALLWKNWLCRLRHPVSAACLPEGPRRGRGAGIGGDGGRVWPACPPPQGTGGRSPVLLDSEPSLRAEVAKPSQPGCAVLSEKGQLRKTLKKNKGGI